MRNSLYNRFVVPGITDVTLQRQEVAMRIKAVLLDMDGTVLYTLPDARLALNMALAEFGLPPRTLDETRRFVGNGIHRLIELAVPAGTSPETAKGVLDAFHKHYAVHCNDTSGPYDGILDMLRDLKSKGIKTAIVSNKPDYGVQALSKVYFADLVDFNIGQQEGIARKPASDMVFRACEALGVSPADAVYVGDSEPDILTAQNAAMPGILVTWGFRDRQTLLDNGAEYLIDSPADLYPLLETL